MVFSELAEGRKPSGSSRQVFKTGGLAPGIQDRRARALPLVFAIPAAIAVGSSTSIDEHLDDAKHFCLLYPGLYCDSFKLLQTN